MVQMVKYPGTLSHGTGQGNTIPFKNCDDINNLKNDNASQIAHWGNSNPGSRYVNAIAGKNGSRFNPEYIRASNFQFNLPDNAKVTTVSVQYAYRKRSYSSNTSEGTHGSFAGPVITLPSLGLKTTGHAPPRNDYGYYYNRFDNLNLKGKDLNKSDFEVLFDIPKNTSTNPAWIEMIYLRVIVIYTAKNYVPTVNLSKDELMYGEESTVTCSIQETSGTVSSETVGLTFDLPSGFNYTGLSSTSTGSITTSEGKGRVSFTVSPGDASQQGVFSIGFKENATSHSASIPLTVKKPGVKCTGFQLINKEVEVSTSDVTNSAVLEFSLYSQASTVCTLKFDFDGLSYSGITLNDSNEFTVETTDWTANSEGYVFSKQLTLSSTVEGDYVISMTSDSFISTYSDTLTVVLPTLSTPYYTLLNLNDFTLSQLKDGERYVFSCLGRVKDADRVVNGLVNNRASVRVGEDEIFTNKISGVDYWEELSCEFTYNSNQPIFIVFYGNYTEYDLGTVEFGNPLIVQADDYTGYEYPVFIFEPISLLMDKQDYANALIEPPERSSTTRHFFTGFNWQGIDESDVLIHGIEVNGDISTTAPVNITVGIGKQGMDELDYNLDSTYVDETDSSFQIGGQFRSFGIPLPDINSMLPDLKFFMEVEDSYDNITPFNVDMKNIAITLYYSLNNGEGFDFYINGVSSKYYMIDLNPETVIPRGANFDADTYKVTGADGEYPTYANITNNTINLNFYVFGDCPEGSHHLMKYVSEYLYPDRDSLDNPILKEISFFFDKEHCYDYYIEDSIESKAIPGGYECSVDLIVPSGLQRSVDKVRVSYAGDIITIGKVKPEIYLYKVHTSDDADDIQVIESESGKTLTLTGDFIKNLPEFTNLKIDCEERKVYYEEFDEWFLVDSSCIGIDSEFFVIDRGFNFEKSVNCKVKNVVYYELTG